MNIANIEDYKEILNPKNNLLRRPSYNDLSASSVHFINNVNEDVTDEDFIENNYFSKSKRKSLSTPSLASFFGTHDYDYSIDLNNHYVQEPSNKLTLINQPSVIHASKSSNDLTNNFTNSHLIDQNSMAPSHIADSLYNKTLENPMPAVLQLQNQLYEQYQSQRIKKPSLTKSQTPPILSCRAKNNLSGLPLLTDNLSSFKAAYEKLIGQSSTSLSPTLRLNKHTFPNANLPFQFSHDEDYEIQRDKYQSSKRPSIIATVSKGSNSENNLSSYSNTISLIHGQPIAVSKNGVANKKKFATIPHQNASNNEEADDIHSVHSEKFPTPFIIQPKVFELSSNLNNSAIITNTNYSSANNYTNNSSNQKSLNLSHIEGSTASNNNNESYLGLANFTPSLPNSNYNNPTSHNAMSDSLYPPQTSNVQNTDQRLYHLNPTNPHHGLSSNSVPNLLQQQQTHSFNHNIVDNNNDTKNNTGNQTENNATNLSMGIFQSVYPQTGKDGSNLNNNLFNNPGPDAITPGFPAVYQNILGASPASLEYINSLKDSDQRLPLKLNDEFHHFLRLHRNYLQAQNANQTNAIKGPIKTEQGNDQLPLGLFSSNELKNQPGFPHLLSQSYDGNNIINMTGSNPFYLSNIVSTSLHSQHPQKQVQTGLNNNNSNLGSFIQHQNLNFNANANLDILHGAKKVSVPANMSSISQLTSSNFMPNALMRSSPLSFNLNNNTANNLNRSMNNMSNNSSNTSIDSSTTTADKKPNPDFMMDDSMTKDTNNLSNQNAHQTSTHPFMQTQQQTYLYPGSSSSQTHIVEEAARKREVRLLKNREAAKECRRKKKEYVKCLENRVTVLENQNKALIEELKALKELYCQKQE